MTAIPRERNLLCPQGQFFKTQKVLACDARFMTALFKAAALAYEYSFPSFNFAFRMNAAFDMPAKRSAPSEVPSRKIRKKAGPTRDALPESMTIEERAEPFRLRTVNFPIDEVDAKWSMGSNRDVDAKHVRQLCQVFDEHGLQRQDRTHHARLLCRADDVRAMCDRLGMDAALQRPQRRFALFRRLVCGRTIPCRVAGW